MSDVIDNTGHSRFELAVNGQIVFADYRRDGNRLYIDHVEAPMALRGTGAAGRLMEGLMDVAKSRGDDVIPICSYAVAWLKRHS